MKLSDYLKKVISELQPQVKEAEFEVAVWINSLDEIVISDIKDCPNKIKFKIKRK